MVIAIIAGACVLMVCTCSAAVVMIVIKLRNRPVQTYVSASPQLHVPRPAQSMQQTIAAQPHGMPITMSAYVHGPNSHDAQMPPQQTAIATPIQCIELGGTLQEKPFGARDEI